MKIDKHEIELLANKEFRRNLLAGRTSKRKKASTIELKATVSLASAIKSFSFCG